MQPGKRTPEPPQSRSASDRLIGDIHDSDTCGETSLLSDLALWRGMVESMADLVYLCNTRGIVIYRNPALNAYVGRDAAGVPGFAPRDQETVLMSRPNGTRVDPVDAPAQRAARTGETQAGVELVLRLPDGTERLTVWNAAPVRDAQGIVIGASGVGRDVTDEHLLAQAREDWLAAAAHDLRNPVAALLGHVQLAHRTLRAHLAAKGTAAAGSSPAPHALPSTAQPAGSHIMAPRSDKALLERLKHHVEVAEASVQDLRRRMDTLLDASAAVAGNLILRHDPDGVDLTLLVRQAAEQAGLAAVRHTFTVTTPEHPVVVPGDRERLRQLIENLLANAMKFSPEGGPILVDITLSSNLPEALSATAARVDIAAKQTDPAAGDAGLTATRENATDEWALVRVEDQGIGIPASDVPHVFERYRRATGRAARIRGAGLGLYTCRAIADAHGGFIGVERTAVAGDQAPNPQAALEHYSQGDRAGAEQAGTWHGTTLLLALPYHTVELAGPASGAATASTGPDPKGAL